LIASRKTSYRETRTLLFVDEHMLNEYLEMRSIILVRLLILGSDLPVFAVVNLILLG
jgi:hypothetical protein